MILLNFISISRTKDEASYNCIKKSVANTSKDLLKGKPKGKGNERVIVDNRKTGKVKKKILTKEDIIHSTRLL